MTAAKHTPGPWLIDDFDKAFVYTLGPGGTNKFWAPIQASGPEKISRNEAEANARLIAAAPELFEALRDMLSGWIYIRESHGDLYGVGWDRAQNKAQEAIAKATGSAP